MDVWRLKGVKGNTKQGCVLCAIKEDHFKMMLI
jgi:hypothetical protein